MIHGDLKIGTWVGLLFTPLLIAGGQVLFKLTSRQAGNLDAQGLMQLMLNPFLIAALVLYGAGTLIWIFVLKAVPLTIAYPFMALSFCAVPLLAHFLLGEPVSWRLALGTALIIAGMLTITTG